MDNNCKTNSELNEQLEDAALDTVAGGSGHIDHIICPTCGYELPVHGQHNYVRFCPRCGGGIKTW